MLRLLKEYTRGFKFYGFSKKSFQWILYRLKFNFPALFDHRPVHLDLELTTLCNLKCPFCFRQTKTWRNLSPEEEISPVIFIILREAYKTGFRSIKLNWRGDSFCCTPCFAMEIAKAAREYGFLDVIVNTNLANSRLQISKENLEYFTEIRVSLDTIKSELYEKLRYPAYLDEVTKNLAKLIDNFDPRKKRLVIQRRTIPESETDNFFEIMLKTNLLLTKLSASLGEIKEFKNKLDYLEFNSKPAQPRNNSELADKEKSYYELWRQGKLKRRYCKQPSQRIVIGANGKVHACCLNYFEHGSLTLGKLAIRDSMQNIVNSNWRKKIISQLQKNDFDFLPVCEKCSSFMSYKK